MTGEILIGIATGGAVKAASKTATVAKITQKVSNTKVARAVAKVSEATVGRTTAAIAATRAGKAASAASAKIGQVTQAADNLVGRVSGRIKPVQYADELGEAAAQIAPRVGTHVEYVLPDSRLVSQFDTFDPPVNLMHGTNQPTQAFMHGIDVSRGGGQLGPGFYVTQERAVADWFARYFHPGPEARILHMPASQRALSELRILRLTEDSPEYLRLSAVWGDEIPSDLRYLIDDYDAIEAPIFYGNDQVGIQLKFNPRAQSFIDRFPLFFEELQ